MLGKSVTFAISYHENACKVLSSRKQWLAMVILLTEKSFFAVLWCAKTGGRRSARALGRVTQKVSKLFGRISGDLILFVSSKRRRLEARNVAVIFIFISCTTCKKTSFTEQAGRSSTKGFSGLSRNGPQDPRMAPDRNRTQATLVGGKHSYYCAIPGCQSQREWKMELSLPLPGILSGRICTAPVLYSVLTYINCSWASKLICVVIIFKLLAKSDTPIWKKAYTFQVP